MKQLLFALMLFCALQTKAQTKDSSKIDSVQINLSLEQYQRVFGDIQTQIQGRADIKPEEWQMILQILYTNTKPKKK